jgi:Na+-transporting methylmalonyl-CoA/oxaloacetate decarboxylase gamma subunit
MELTDALTITVLGMAVVFSGLLLTAGLIVAFGRLHRRLEAPAGPDTEPAPVRATAAPGEPIDNEVLCVIAAVLEVERRLHRLDDRRADLSRHPEPADE